MEREKPTQQEELQQIGRSAADALRGYGYPYLAQEYERSLHRAGLDRKEMLAHSQIASTALKELNQLAEARQGKHPALERNVQLQQQLAASLQKQTETGVNNTKPLDTLSFPGKLFLEKHSKPLEHAAQEVRNYLHEKQQSTHPAADKPLLQRSLENQLASFRALPTAYNMEQLETHTRKGLSEMQQDYQQTQRTTQQANERYVAERDFLSAHGRSLILSEAEKGEFEMPNRQKGAYVAVRIDRIEQQLAQYSKTKQQVLALDSNQSERNANVHSNDSAQGFKSSIHATHDFAHLSEAQQDRFADLSKQMPPVQRSISTELER